MVVQTVVDNVEYPYEELFDVGDQDQTPFLVDTQREVALYESDDIVEYLENHYG